MGNGNGTAPSELVGTFSGHADETPVERMQRNSYRSEKVREAVKIGRKVERDVTKGNLKIAALMVDVIEHDQVTYCPSRDDVASFRDDSIGAFSGPLSRATGQALTTRRLAEYLRVEYLRESLNAIGGAKDFARVTWESLRVLARWSIYVPGETWFERGESYGETWKIQDGCEEKLVDLIVKQSSAKPYSRKDLVKAMDAHERELSGKTDDVVSDNFAKIAAFLKSMDTQAEKLGLSSEALNDWLLRAGIVKPQSGSFDASKLTTNEADRIAASLIAATNHKAMDTIVKRIDAFYLGENAKSKPATSASATLNETTPNNDPIGDPPTN